MTFYANIAGAIGPFVASLTIKDAPEGSGGKVNSVQEDCTKCFAVHILKFEILQSGNDRIPKPSLKTRVFQPSA